MRLEEMKHFDYKLGHIDHVGEMSYDNFQQLLHDQAHSSGSAADLHHHVEQFISGVLPGSDEAPADHPSAL